MAEQELKKMKTYTQSLLRFIGIVALRTTLCGVMRADVGLMLDEALRVGASKWTGAGHSAVYLSGVCMATPVELRVCEPGENGVVLTNYIFGEDPLQTEPDLGMMREAFAKLDLIIVQDIFMTKTAMMADVILPATSWGEHENVFSSADRGFQRCYQAIKAPGDVKHDWEIHSLMATALGYPMHYNNAQEIWDELRGLCHLYTGATYEKMADLGYVQWPCETADHPGTPWLYEGNKFDTPSGKAQLFAAEWRAPLEKVDADYPMGLCTVREVGHYSCRSMTGNCTALQTLADEPGFVQIHPDDAKKLGIKDQALCGSHRVAAR